MIQSNENIEFVQNEDIFAVFNKIYQCHVIAIHCVVVVIFAPFTSIKHLFSESWVIFKTVWKDLILVKTFFINLIYVWLLTWSTTKIFLIRDRKPYLEYSQMMACYEEMKRIMDYFQFTPLRRNQAVIIHLLLGKFPDVLWENILPYPNVFFEDSITNAYSGTEKIYVSEERRNGPFKKQPSMIKFKDNEERKNLEIPSSSCEISSPLKQKYP